MFNKLPNVQLPNDSESIFFRKIAFVSWEQLKYFGQNFMNLQSAVSMKDLVCVELHTKYAKKMNALRQGTKKICKLANNLLHFLFISTK